MQPRITALEKQGLALLFDRDMTMAWKEQQWQERAITPLFLRVSSSPHLADLKPQGLSRNISAPFLLFAL